MAESDIEVEEATAMAATQESPPVSARPEVQPLIKNFKQVQSSALFRQVLAATGPVLAGISFGMTVGYSAVALPQLRQPNSTIPINTEEASWIAGIAVLPTVFGSLLGGFLMEHFGRRMTHFILCVPFVFGWVLVAASQNIAMMYSGRFFTGLCLGALCPPGQVYIGEVSEPKYRGLFLATPTFAVSVGVVLVYILGTFLDWSMVAAISATVPFLCYVVMSLVPESPNWLVSQKRLKDAEQSMYWLRGRTVDADKELKLLVDSMLEREAKTMSWSECMKDLLKPSFLKPFVILNIFFVAQQFSGVNAVVFYSVHIFEETGGKGNEYMATIIVGIVRMVMSVVACLLLRRIGRRPLAIVSSVGTTVSLIGLGLFLHFTSDSVKTAWVPMIFLITYMCFVSIGLVPLPWVMIGEVFPSAVRGVGSGATASFGFLLFFLVVKTCPAMFETMGSDGVFWFYGGVALFGTIFIILCLPETKNKTLKEIEDYFNGVRRKESSTKSGDIP